MADRFYGKTKPMAVAFILHEAGRPMRGMEIRDALYDGGFTDLMADKMRGITTALEDRAARRGDVEKIGRGLWAPKGVLFEKRQLSQ